MRFLSKLVGEKAFSSLEIFFFLTGNIFFSSRDIFFFLSPEIWRGFVEGVSLDEDPTCRPRWESGDL